MNSLLLGSPEVNPAADSFALIPFDADFDFDFDADPIIFDNFADAEYDAWLDRNADRLSDEAKALEMVCSGHRPW